MQPLLVLKVCLAMARGVYVYVELLKDVSRAG